MKISQRRIGYCLLLTLITTGSLQAQEKSPEEIQKSCRNFVQAFYDKFVRAQKSSKPTSYASDPALHPELRRLLKEDREAQDRDTSGDIVGLDFDPIAAGNEVYDRYEAGEVKPKGDRYWVEVFCLWGKKRDPDQKLMYEVQYTNNRWMIMNIHYYQYRKGKLVDQHDLLGTLKKLREERRKKSR